MAVAIKATATLSYYSAIKHFSIHRWPGIDVACPFCGESYHFGPEMMNTKPGIGFTTSRGRTTHTLATASPLAKNSQDPNNWRADR